MMSVAFIPVYIRYLGIEAYGLIGIFALLQAWLVLLDMGMSPTLSRELARFTGGAHDAQFVRDLLRSMELLAFAVAALIAIVIVWIAQWLATNWLRVETLPIEVVANAFALMGCITALRLIENIYRSSLVGLQRQVALNVIMSVMVTLRGAGAVAILIWLSPTIKAFFVWQAIVSLFTVAVYATMTYGYLPRAERAGRLSASALLSVWRFAGGMLGVTFLALLLTQVDKIVLSRLLSLTEFGYYSFAAVVAGGLYALVGPIVQAYQPRLAQLHAETNDAQFAHTYHRGSQLIAVIVGSAAITLIVHSTMIMNLWSANPDLAARSGALLSILAFGTLLHSLMMLPYQAQLAYGWTRLAVVVNVVAVVIVIPAIFIVTPRFGAYGAAWVWTGLNLGYVFVSVHFMFKRILKTEKWSWYVDDAFKPLLAATVTSIALAWLMPAQLPRIWQLVALVVVASLTLLTSTFASSKLRGPLWSAARRIYTQA